MRAVGAALSIALSVIASRAQEPAKETMIDISFDDIDIRARPAPMNSPATVHHEYHVVLSNRNQVAELHTSTASSDGLVGHNKIDANLGSELAHSNVGWHVAGPNSLVRLEDHPQNTLAMKINIGSNNTCELIAVSKLKPGFTEYTFFSMHQHTLAYYSRWDIVNRTCSIK